MPFELPYPLQFHGIISTIGPMDILDIFIVAVILYKVYVMLQDTRAITLVKGILVLLGVTMVCSWLELHVISWLLQKAVTLLFVALPIVFQPELRRALNTVLVPRAQNLPLFFSEGTWIATISDPTLLQSCKLVLAVRARMPYDQVQRQFIQQSKVAATDKIRSVVSVQVPGIPLHTLTAAPRQLPWHEGYVYFELEKGTPAWQDVIKAGALALHISGSFPDLNLQLWAIRG